MRSFKLDIVSPDGRIFSGEAERLLVRTSDGDVEILAGHTDLFATLDVGRVKLTAGSEIKYGSASGGFLTVKGGCVTLATVTFEFADDIDINRANLAKQKAEEALKNAKAAADIEVANAKLGRAMSRISVASTKL